MRRVAPLRLLTLGLCCHLMHTIPDHSLFPPEEQNCITKLVEIILRERVMGKTLFSLPNHFLTGEPLYIDLLTQKILERWVIRFNPHQETDSHDTSDLILLLQSVYAQTRLVPLGALLSQDNSLKSKITFKSF